VTPEIKLPGVGETQNPRATPQHDNTQLFLTLNGTYKCLYFQQQRFSPAVPITLTSYFLSIDYSSVSSQIEKNRFMGNII
jgi:hypothetical protein